MADEYLLASFSDPEAAADAYNKLLHEGIEGDAISVITTEETRDALVREMGGDDEMVEGDEDVTVGEGAVTGAAVGGLAGLVVSAVPLAIAGLPSLIVVGPLAAALGLTGVAGTTVTGATTGAVAGGLYGALDNLGMSEEEAKDYERTVQEGGIVFAVGIDEDSEGAVREILEDYGAEDIRTGELAA